MRGRFCAMRCAFSEASIFRAPRLSSQPLNIPRTDSRLLQSRDFGPLERAQHVSAIEVKEKAWNQRR